MSRIKLDSGVIQCMSFFEQVTHTRLKDCISSDDQIIFVVEEGEIGKAIGKYGSNVKLIENKLNRKIKIIEFNSDLLQFVQNTVHPLKLKDAKTEGKTVIMTASDMPTRGLLIGRSAKNLRAYEAIVKRYFDIDKMMVN